MTKENGPCSLLEYQGDEKFLEVWNKQRGRAVQKAMHYMLAEKNATETFKRQFE